MKEPMVSAVMMTYNRPLFVQKGIELFTAQTWPNKELLIVDDGPEGGVPKYLPDNVRHIRCERAWLPEKRNIALENAHGEFIAGFDDDDYFSPNRLEKQVHAMLAGADVSGYALDYLAILPALMFRRWNHYSNRTVPLHDGTAMFRRELLLSLPVEQRKELGIYDIIIELKKRGLFLMEVPNRHDFIYLRHTNSVWKNEWKENSRWVPFPDWIPAHMIEFWSKPELTLEGVGGGAYLARHSNA